MQIGPLPSRIRPYGPKGIPEARPGGPRGADAKRAGWGQPERRGERAAPEGQQPRAGAGLGSPSRSSCSERRRGARRKRRRKGLRGRSPSPYRVATPHQDAEQRIAGRKYFTFCATKCFFLVLVLLARTEDPRLGSPWPPPRPLHRAPRPGPASTRRAWGGSRISAAALARRVPVRPLVPVPRSLAVPAWPAGEEGCARLAPRLAPAPARPRLRAQPAAGTSAPRAGFRGQRRRHDAGAEGARAAAAAPPGYGARPRDRYCALALRLGSRGPAAPGGAGELREVAPAGRGGRRVGVRGRVRTLARRPGEKSEGWECQRDRSPQRRRSGEERRPAQRRLPVPGMGDVVRPWDAAETRASLALRERAQRCRP